MNRKIKSQIFCLLTILLVLVSLISCKPEIESKLVPVLSTETISSITQNTAVCGGNITSDNGLEVTSRGVCWNLKPNPTINDSLTKDATGTGKFISKINNLLPDTTYYVRAYATNSGGTAYGLQISFKTLKGILPVLTTTKATNLSDISATSGGSITFNGGTAITERGVCWSTNPFPTITNNKTLDGNGSGIFTSAINNLSEGTKYYIRAYAVNNTGIGYGVQDTITTLTKPTLVTNVMKSITKNTAISGGNIISDGGSPITARGVVWATSPNPTTSLSTKTTDGTGIGTFTSNISGLVENVTYYIRAYATNIIGTSYGQQLSFETNYSGTFVDSRDGNLYKWIRIGDQIWMAENLKYLPSVQYLGVNSFTTPYYYVYDYNSTNVTDAKATANYKTYGVLYNWKAACSSCPKGWHLPSDAEWTQLTEYLGGISGAGAKLKESGTTHWYNPNTGTTNETGFTALPGGYRNNIGALFGIGSMGVWWSATEFDTSKAWERHLHCNYSNIYVDNFSKEGSVSVRCVRD